MMDPIDYTDRLNLLQRPELDRVKQLYQTIENSKNESSPAKSFKDYLNEEVNKEILGKVPSANVKRPGTIKEEVSADPEKKRLYNACVEFESIFVKMMLNQMKKSIHKSGMIDGGHAEEIFEDMLYDEHAKQISKNESLGLAEQMYESLSAALP